MNHQAGDAHSPPGCPDLESVRSLFLVAQVMHEVSLFVQCSNRVFAAEATSLPHPPGAPSKSPQMFAGCVAVKSVLRTCLLMCSHAEM